MTKKISWPLWSPLQIVLGSLRSQKWQKSSENHNVSKNMTFYSCAMSIEADLAKKCSIEGLNGLKTDFGGLNWPQNPSNFHLKAWFIASFDFFDPVTYVYVDWGQFSQKMLNWKPKWSKNWFWRPQNGQKSWFKLLLPYGDFGP